MSERAARRPGDWLRVTRAPFAATAVSDAVGCAILALAAAGRGPGDLSAGAWAGLAGTSLALYAAGMAGNDLADRERDRMLAPRRPLPAGRLSPRAVAGAVALLAAAAVALGGGPAGSRAAAAAAVALALAYDFLRPLGVLLEAVLMGGVRAANASLAVWPLVVAGDVPALALLAPAAVGAYAAGITVLSTAEDRSGPARPLVARALTGLSFAAMAALAGWAAGGAALGVSLGWLFAGTVVLSAAFGRTPRPGPVRQQVREMLLGLYWLGFVAASAGDGGSLGVAGAALGAAFALILASQWAVRRLAAVSAAAPPGGG